MEDSDKDLKGKAWLDSLYNNRKIDTSEAKQSKAESSYKERVAKYTENPIYYHADHDVRQELVLKNVSDEILKNEVFIHFRDSEELYFFNDSLYLQYGEQFAKEITNHTLGGEYTSHRANEVVNLIKTSILIKHLEHHADGAMPLTLIPLANGVYNTITEQLQPYDKDLLFFSRLPVAYDPGAECPRFRQFLDEVVDKGDQPLLQEWLGYCLLRDYPFDKALLLVGSGRNGKSVFLRVVEDLLGHDNVSGISLQTLCFNRFAKAELFNKLANIYADLPDKAVHETGEFKMLTGNDSFTTEKKHTPFFKMRNYAKLLFSCNQIPESYDPTDAYYDRYHIITFPNKFLGDKADEHLGEKLRMELPGILKFALQGLNRLLSQHHFSYSKSLEETRDYYRRASSTVAAYVDDKLDVDEMGVIVKEELYVSYTEYCRENKLIPEHKQVFSQKLPEYIAVTSTICSVPGYKQRQHVWRGLKFKSRNEEENLQKEAENQQKLDSYAGNHTPTDRDQHDQPDQPLNTLAKKRNIKTEGRYSKPDQVDQPDHGQNITESSISTPQPRKPRRIHLSLPCPCGGQMHSDVEADEALATAYCEKCTGTFSIRLGPDGWKVVEER